MSALYPVPMDACVKCHGQKSATVACLDCHREHHSFPDAVTAAATGGPGSGFDGFLIGMLALTLAGFGYVYADMRLVRRWLEAPKLPPPAVGKGPGGEAPSPAAEAPKGEILPFPQVDVEACISCSSCYNSCPKQVLAGDDHGKSTVVNPDACIALEGCSICEQGCPTGATASARRLWCGSVDRPTSTRQRGEGAPRARLPGEVIGAALISPRHTRATDAMRTSRRSRASPRRQRRDHRRRRTGRPRSRARGEAPRPPLPALERDTVASTIKNYPRDKAVLAEPIRCRSMRACR